MNLKPSEAIVVENAPLGIQAAIDQVLIILLRVKICHLIFSLTKGTISLVDRETKNISKDRVCK
jgi:hypothetical protein